MNSFLLWMAKFQPLKLQLLIFQMYLIWYAMLRIQLIERKVLRVFVYVRMVYKKETTTLCQNRITKEMIFIFSFFFFSFPFVQLQASTNNYSESVFCLFAIIICPVFNRFKIPNEGLRKHGTIKCRCFLSFNLLN